MLQNALHVLENLHLRATAPLRVDGLLRMAPGIQQQFLQAPFDIAPAFEGPPSKKRLRRGRGKDHPRYGRYIYALAKTLKPNTVVEVGSYAGGTAVGWARAMVENGVGKLFCIDLDVYSKGTYPEVTRRNVLRAGLPESRFELLNGNSKDMLPALCSRLKDSVDIVLIDGDHTYEGALTDIQNGLPLLRPGGLLLVHDVDRARRMNEQTPEHPHPVYEAFRKAANDSRSPWCVLTYIRKHLGVMQKPAA